MNYQYKVNLYKIDAPSIEEKNIIAPIFLENIELQNLGQIMVNEKMINENMNEHLYEFQYNENRIHILNKEKVLDQDNKFNNEYFNYYDFRSVGFQMFIFTEDLVEENKIIISESDIKQEEINKDKQKTLIYK